MTDVDSCILYRIHPHHHGASSLQTHTATVPVMIEVNPDGGFDPLGSASCADMKTFFPEDDSNEIVLHFQVSLSQSTSSCLSHSMLHAWCMLAVE